MKTIKLSRFKILEFEDSDPDYECIQKLLQLKEENKLNKTDFDVIASMFELHKNLPPAAKILYDNGFLLPKNQIEPGISHEAVWVYKQENEPTKTIKYKDRYVPTEAHQSDSYTKNSEYTTEDLTAEYTYKVLMSDYGKTKKTEKHCIIKVKQETILEYTKNENR